MVASKNRRKIANCETAFPFLTYGQQETRLGSLGYGEKNMKRKLIAVALLAMGGIALAAGGVASALHSPEQAIAVDTAEDGTVLVKTAQDLIDTFKDETYLNSNIRLENDIDVSGITLPQMTGEYAGTFDGNGHKIYNVEMKSNNTLFNIINANGTVKNLTVETYSPESRIGVVRPLAYLNNGTIENCKVVMTINAHVDNLAAFSYLAGSGYYKNLEAHFLFNTTDVEWLCVINRDGTIMEGHMTDCIYTVTGLNGLAVGDTLNFQSNGATKTEDVTYVKTDGEHELTIGASETLKPVTAGTEYTAVAWSSENDKVASVTQEGVVTGVGAGSTTIKVEYTTASGKASGLYPVTVMAAAEVSGIEIDAETLEIEQFMETKVTATLTGTEYQSIVWASADPETVEVTGNGLEATIKALEVTAEPVNVTVTVYGETEKVLASDMVAVTVAEALGFNVNLLIPQIDPVMYAGWGDTAYFFAYGAGADNVPTPLARQYVNGKPFNLTYDVGGDDGVVECWVYSGFISANAHNITAATTFFQISMNQDGRWGGGVQLLNLVDGAFTDLTIVAGKNSPDLPTKVDTYNNDDFLAAKAHAAASTHGDAWRDENGSICYLIDGEHDARLNEVLTAYDGVTDPAVKALVDGIVDGDGANKTTYGNTIQYLRDHSNLNPEGTYVAANNAISFFGFDGNGNSSLMILALFAGLGTIVLVGGIAIYRHRKNRA